MHSYILIPLTVCCAFIIRKEHIIQELHGHGKSSCSRWGTFDGGSFGEGDERMRVAFNVFCGISLVNGRLY
jgi:hypothetical protein